MRRRALGLRVLSLSRETPHGTRLTGLHATAAVMPGLRAPAGRRVWAAQTAVMMVLLWLALDGAGNPAIGIAAALLGTGLGAWLAPGEPYPIRVWPLLRFAGYFVRESVRGGVDVARRALDARLPISPEIVEHRVTLTPGMPRTILVAAVSLLPGTLSVNLRDDGILRVHVLRRELLPGVAELERRVAMLFPAAA